MVGSAGDGFGFYASQGTNQHIFEENTVLTQDIEYIFLNSIKVEPHHLEAVPESVGFTWIKLSPSEVSKMVLGS